MSAALLRRPELMVAAVLVVAVLVIGSINPVFWQPANLFSLLRASVVTGILALAVLLGTGGAPSHVDVGRCGREEDSAMNWSTSQPVSQHRWAWLE